MKKGTMTRMAIAPLGLAATLAACDVDTPRPGRTGSGGTGTSADTADTGGSTDSGPDTDTAEACAVERFAPVATSWKLPTAYEGAAFERVGAEDERDFAWRLVRVQEKPALLVMRAKGMDEVGTRKWVLHPAEAEGFAERGVDWALPADASAWGDALPDAYDAVLAGKPIGVDDSAGAVANRPWLTDIDADGYPDLVTFGGMGDGDAGSAGETPGGTARAGWKVYEGSAAGFSDSGTNWIFPEGAPVAAFNGRADTTPGDAIQWRLADVDGDARVDLIVLRNSADADVGTKHWVVHPNTGDGFGPGVEWALPATADGGSVAGGGRFLADMDGDGKPDLVVPRTARTVGGDLPDGAGPGDTGASEGSSGGDTGASATTTPRWTVYRNTGTGFGRAVSWELPADYPTGTFSGLASAEGRELGWAIRDLTGDGVPDLVIVRDEREGAVGATGGWRVFPGKPAGERIGWTGSPVEFVLPTGLPEGALAASEDVSESSPDWLLLDIDGDSRLDLLITRWRGGTEPGIGTEQWRAYKGQCAGEDGAGRDTGTDTGRDTAAETGGDTSDTGGDTADTGAR
jgi:hypothetical protein